MRALKKISLQQLVPNLETTAYKKMLGNLLRASFSLVYVSTHKVINESF